MHANRWYEMRPGHASLENSCSGTFSKSFGTQDTSYCGPPASRIALRRLRDNANRRDELAGCTFARAHKAETPAKEHTVHRRRFRLAIHAPRGQGPGMVQVSRRTVICEIASRALARHAQLVADAGPE